MEILAAYDLTQSYRDAAALAGCDHHTVARYVAARGSGRLSDAPARRAQAIDAYREELEERVEVSHGRVPADGVHGKLAAAGDGASRRSTPRAGAGGEAHYP